MTNVDTWAGQIDAHIAEMNAIKGTVAPAPLFKGSPLSFPLQRGQITEDLLRSCARAAGAINPMWDDSKYGSNSLRGTVIGPPILEASLADLVTKDEVRQ